MENAAGTTYWCHRCSRSVIPSIEGEIFICNFCQNGFVEEIHNTQDSVANDQNNDGEIDIIGQLEEIRSIRSRHSVATLNLFQTILNNLSLVSETNEVNSEHATSINSFNRRINSLNQRINQRISVHQNFIDSVSVPSRTLGDYFIGPGFASVPSGSLGDYFIGPGFEMLLERLAETDLDNRYGTPPAAKEAVEALANVKIEESLLQCSVCLDDFEIGMEAKEMPCMHKFHSDCLLPWLELHSSCPVCRSLLPTADDNDDEPKTNDGNNDGFSIASMERNNGSSPESSSNNSGSQSEIGYLNH